MKIPGACGHTWPHSKPDRAEHYCVQPEGHVGPHACLCNATQPNLTVVASGPEVAS